MQEQESDVRRQNRELRAENAQLKRDLEQARQQSSDLATAVERWYERGGPAMRSICERLRRVGPKGG